MKPKAGGQKLRHVASINTDSDLPAYEEKRGIRKFSTDSRPDFLARYGRLSREAEKLLSKAGERGLQEVKDGADDPGRNDDRAALAEALAQWWAEIAARRGALHPIAAAAQFLGTRELVAFDLAEGFDTRNGDAVKGLSDKMLQVFSFCDAWHWWHLELYGEHNRAFDGLIARQNLSAAGDARTARQRRRKAIIERCCNAYWEKKPAHRNNARRTTAALAAEINSALKTQGEQEYRSDHALGKVIREIIDDRPEQGKQPASH